MKVSREQVALNRRRILSAAGRLFRDRGFDAVSIAEVMDTAGLTHGGFYGYFASKEDLIAAVVADLVSAPIQGGGDLATVMAAYLNVQHRDDRAGGCPVAALGGELVRHSPAARSAMSEGVRARFDELAAHHGDGNGVDARTVAIGSWAAMIGAVVLARMIPDEALSREILDATRDLVRAAAVPSPR